MSLVFYPELRNRADPLPLVLSKPEEDLFWQKDGQQWQSNGWEREPDIDGPTEFAFNGTSEKDFDAVGSEKVLWDPPNTVGDYKGE
mgnify:CR=1 FL=1